ncbi:MAG: hypothetical protein A2Y95_03335 [Deltaproteobacteria bacterium RBG_13_65_10]|nr:MAG: hypothetical protein A2Y95_03335 [Deltaproteobacteria bacterium RBG_13_65_10]
MKKHNATRSFSIALATLAILFATPALSLSTGRPGKHLRFPAHRMIENRAKLGLTDAQVSKLEGMDQAFQDRTSGLRESMRSQRRELRKLLEDNAVSRAEAERRIDVLSQDVASLHRERMRTFLDAREVLTPPQRQKMGEISKGMRQKRGGDQPEGPGGR